MRDLKNNLNAVNSLNPATRTASANGTGVDLQGYEGALALIITGAITDGTHAFKLQESDDDSTYTDVASGDLIGSFSSVTSTSGGNSNQRVGYIGAKRYIRVVVTVSGATSGGIYGAVVVRGYARHLPL